MSAKPIIRKAGPDDAQPLSALAERTFKDTFGPQGFDLGYPETDLTDFLVASYATERVAHWISNPRELVLVAEDTDGELLAYVQAGDNSLPYNRAAAGDGELKRIYVTRSAQGDGLGRLLLEHALDWLGVRPILIGVWSLNLKAQRLYAHYGFEAVGTYQFMVGATADEEIILRRAPSKR